MATTQSKKESASKAASTLSKSESALIDAYWRAANYLSVGQIYLFDNPLLREPLKEEHIKPRLLGHWGTTPGLNFIYAHLNRQIKKHDLDMIYITGPGHGGPGLVANTYLEGAYSEVYPGISQDAEGMKRLFTQFSFPGGIPSHVAPETPGSIHEGGERSATARSLDPIQLFGAGAAWWCLVRICSAEALALSRLMFLWLRICRECEPLGVAGAAVSA